MADDIYDSDGRFIPNFTPYFHDKLIQFQGREKDALTPEEREKRFPAAYILTLVFGEIAWKCREYGVCWATQSYIAKMLGFSRNTVNRALGELVESDEIHMHFCGEGIRNVYTLDNVSPITVNKRLDYAAVSKTIRVEIEEPVTEVYTPCKRRVHPPVNEGCNRIDKDKRQTKKNNSVASVERYPKTYSSKNDEYVLELLDERDLKKLKRGIIKKQEEKERKGTKPFSDLDAVLLDSVKKGYWKSFLPGYDIAKEAKKRKGESEDERIERFRQSAAEVES